MKKIKNKFILLILILVIIISLVGIYNSFFYQIDRNTYAILMQGEGAINNNALIIDKKEVLENGDIVKSIGDYSLVVIEWGDGSVTRLGPNSSIQINELYVDEDLLKINLSFELLSGKTWSNVLNFMGSDSYFKESFRDLEAGVRGTVFNVDLDNDYISVTNHKISLIGENVNIEIDENKPFSLKTLAFIKLEEFIKNVKDYDFEKLNIKLDEELLRSLREEIYKNLDKYVGPSLEKIKDFTPEKREELYNDLLSKYQDLNFLNSDDGELFSKKIELKEQLVSLASQEEKESLIQSTFIDFKDSLSSGNYAELDNLFTILKDNNSILENLNIDLNNLFEKIRINEELKEIFARNLDSLKSILGVDFNNIYGNIGLDELKEQTIDLYENSKVKETIDEQVGFIKKFLQFLFNK